MKAIIARIVCLSCIAASAESYASRNIIESAGVEIDANQIYVANAALRKFMRNNNQWKCFAAHIYPYGEHIRVDFVPKKNVTKTGQSLIVNNSTCGAGISYIVTNSGKVIKTIHPR